MDIKIDGHQLAIVGCTIDILERNKEKIECNYE